MITLNNEKMEKNAMFGIGYAIGAMLRHRCPELFMGEDSPLIEKLRNEAVEYAVEMAGSDVWDLVRLLAGKDPDQNDPWDVLRSGAWYAAVTAHA